jgi:hypothetical protein
MVCYKPILPELTSYYAAKVHCVRVLGESGDGPARQGINRLPYLVGNRVHETDAMKFGGVI